MLRRSVHRFAKNREANVAIILALMMFPTIYLLGMVLDYTQALRKQVQLDAAADAAAIAAVRPSMLTQTDDKIVEATAKAVFAAKADLPGLSQAPVPTVRIDNVGLQRTITVSYTAKATNNFPALLGSPTWSIGGSSTARASSAPNINFYLVLDDSPSMAIGATSNDIIALTNATSTQPGYSANCGFACHERNPSQSSGASKTTKDNLTIARDSEITLRIDLVVDAVKQLIVGPWSCPQAGVTGGVMQCMAALNNTTYQVALYTFDNVLNEIQKLTSSLSVVGTKIPNIQLFTVDHQNCVVATSCSTDYGTDIAGALKSVNAKDIMPDPGAGTNQKGDTPQEVVFLVTDGVEDKLISSNSSCNAKATKPLPSAGSKFRCQQPLDTSICDDIKKRNIRIAVLYTEYLQLPDDDWYRSRIAQFNNPSSSTGEIAQNLKSCASPGLFANVQTGGDISEALTNLFIKVATSTANLVQ